MGQNSSSCLWSGSLLRQTLLQVAAHTDREVEGELPGPRKCYRPIGCLPVVIAQEQQQSFCYRIFSPTVLVARTGRNSIGSSRRSSSSTSRRSGRSSRSGIRSRSRLVKVLELLQSKKDLVTSLHPNKQNLNDVWLPYSNHVFSPHFTGLSVTKNKQCQYISWRSSHEVVLLCMKSSSFENMMASALSLWKGKKWEMGPRMSYEVINILPAWSF